ncbi:glucan endo-1,3-beta-glucosidase GIV-like [Lolium perenne]|uniref:glucan endo-1,3-beta-glucosidase GIV-like n=1 Tax=Lolium perenne TaxID=4522 RepID=UPI0021F52862|nr:glucan endo-1,3-beta-glucosidase GIV-like [Lolium perenne]
MSSMRGFAPVLTASLLVGVLVACVVPAWSTAVVGVCYGIIGNNLPPPREVVQLYRTYNIYRMRVYSVEHATLDALRNTQVEVTLGTTADEVAFLAASASNAASWVQTNVKPYYPEVRIRYIVVGNELTGGAAQNIVPAMRNLINTLGPAGIAIRVSTAVGMDVVANSFPPSSAVFSQPHMAEVARFLESTNAPLLINVQPYFAYQGNPDKINLSYALFRPGAPPVTDSGNGLVYTNLFDAMVDAMYAALEKAGAPEAWVVVSESGWPSAGGVGATVENARAYNQGLIDHVAYGKGTFEKPGPFGTPKKSWSTGVPLEVYVSSIFNENQKHGEETQRNFGLFHPTTNKLPVYPINFAGTLPHI